MDLIKRGYERLVNCWEATQVELHGHYSIQQFQRFDDYRKSTSWLRAMVVCLVMPLPPIFVLVLVDLLPLEPISNGTSGSPHVWIRQLINIFQIMICILIQVRHHLPKLELHIPVLIFVSVCATVSAVGTSYSASHVIGYPVPFTAVVGTIPALFAICIPIFVFKYSLLRTAPGLTAIES